MNREHTELISWHESGLFGSGKREVNTTWERYRRDGERRTITRLELFKSGKYFSGKIRTVDVRLNDGFYRENPREDVDRKTAEKTIEAWRAETEKAREVTTHHNAKTWYF